MKQLARAKFMSFNLTVPSEWEDPSKDPDAANFNDAFKDNERSSKPDPAGLFRPATLNKYHTDVQKMMNARLGGYMDGIITSI